MSAFRHHLLLTGVSATLAFGVVIACSIFFPLILQLDRGDPAASSTAAIADYFLFVHSAFWPVQFCALVGSVVTALLLHRRMTEPLKRFLRIFQAVEQNAHPDEIHIRDYDYLHFETEALNRMLCTLRDRARERADSAATLSEIADELAESGTDAETVTRIREALKALG